MKKMASVFLCVLVLLTLTVPALAEEDAPPDWLVPGGASSSDSEETGGAPSWLFPDGVPPSTDGPEEDEPPVSDPGPPAAPDPEPPATTPAESTGEKHDTNDTSSPADVPLDTGSSDGYPAGSYIDAYGRVWSPSGELLSPDTSASGSQDEVPVYPVDVLDRADGSEQVAVDLPGTAYVADLRPSDNSPVILDGLKALVTSIFGEYTPITTTTVVTQTVGNDTYQYLVESVAPGSAGVDYEWLAGVLLFAILLYCLMRLLGGVLK